MKELQHTDEFRLLGKRIRELRKRRRLTQGQLAKRADVHPQFISMIERGTTNTTLRALRNIAGALEVSVADLFQYEHTPDPKQVRKRLVDEIKRSSDSEVLLLRRIYDIGRSPNAKN